MPAIQAQTPFPIGNTREPFAIDFDAPFAPTTMTYHGFGIMVDGVYIGRITEWTPQQLDRDFNHVFELNPFTWGQPVDGVPGGSKNYELSFGRAEVWSAVTEQAFGIAARPFAMLLNQTRPFMLDEVYQRNGQIYMRQRYYGCWFTGKNIGQFTGDGDAIVRVDGTIMFVYKDLIMG